MEPLAVLTPVGLFFLFEFYRRLDPIDYTDGGSANGSANSSDDEDAGIPIVGIRSQSKSPARSASAPGDPPEGNGTILGFPLRL